MLGRLLGVLCRMQMMAMGQVSVMTGSFVEAFLVMTGGFAVMARSVLVMLRCLLMMMRCFMRHGEFLSSCRHPWGTRGLS
jgi:hypothetical protein